MLSLDDIEMQLQEWHGRDAATIALLLLAALQGRARSGRRIWLSSRRNADLVRVGGAVLAALPSDWTSNSGDSAPALLLSHSGATADIMDAASSLGASTVVMHHCPDGRSPAYREGVLQLVLNNTEEQTRFVATRSSRRYTMAGRDSERREKAYLRTLSDAFSKHNFRAAVVLPSAVDLPSLKTTPLHLPDVIEMVGSIACGIARLTADAAEPVVHAPSDAITRATALLVRAGAVDHRPEIDPDAVALFAWLDQMELGRLPKTIGEIQRELKTLAFREKLVRQRETQPDLPVYPADRIWERQHVERPLKRLLSCGIVSRERSGTSFVWRISPGYSGWVPRDLYSQLTRV